LPTIVTVLRTVQADNEAGDLREIVEAGSEEAAWRAASREGKGLQSFETESTTKGNAGLPSETGQPLPAVHSSTMRLTVAI